MFTVKADYSETLEINASLDAVRDFFSDSENFNDLMPNIKGIREDSQGVLHWKIVVDVPFVGSFTQKFAVVETENSDELIEWSPAIGEEKNLMKVVAAFLPKGANKTLLEYTQNVELRRKSASQLHFLAGLAGESLISSEMKKGIAEMLDIFLDRAKERLES